MTFPKIEKCLRQEVFVPGNGGTIALSNDPKQEHRLLSRVAKDSRDDPYYFLLKKKWRYVR